MIYMNPITLILMVFNVVLIGVILVWGLYLFYRWLNFAFTSYTDDPYFYYEISRLGKHTFIFFAVLLSGVIFSSYFWSHGPKIVNVNQIPQPVIDHEVYKGPVRNLTPEKKDPREELERLRRSTDGLVGRD